jgi:FSR family fosmidomycin resistance protein-like MFS transporter
MLSGMLPVFITLFNLSYLLAGFLMMVYQVTSSIVQPLLGHWFDRRHVTWLLEVGLIMNGVCMSLAGFSPNYGILLFLIAAAGFGSAAFHPPAFSAVVRSSGSSIGKVMGIFVSAGNVGIFLGPIVAGALISSFGLHGTLATLPIAVLLGLLLFRAHLFPAESHPTGPVRHRHANILLLALLAAVAALRQIAVAGVATFLPVYFVKRGDPLLLATGITSLWLALGVAGQVSGGYLSDRVGERPVIIWSLLLGALVFYGFLQTSGNLSLILLVFSGPLLYASWSVIVAMSARIAPSNVGAVSGFMLGFSVGMGGMLAAIFGAVGDIVGLNYAFDIVAACAFVGGLLGLLIPKQILLVSPSNN